MGEPFPVRPPARPQGPALHASCKIVGLITHGSMTTNRLNLAPFDSECLCRYEATQVTTKNTKYTKTRDNCFLAVSSGWSPISISPDSASVWKPTPTNCLNPAGVSADPRPWSLRDQLAPRNHLTETISRSFTSKDSSLAESPEWLTPHRFLFSHGCGQACPAGNSGAPCKSDSFVNFSPYGRFEDLSPFQPTD